MHPLLQFQAKSMNDLAHDIVLEPATLDVEVWRRALRGMDLVCWAIATLALGLVCHLVIVLPISMVFGVLGFERVGSFVLAVVMLHGAACLGMQLAGAGFGCMAPNDFSAKRCAQSAFVLGLTATIFTSAFIAMELLVLPSVPQQWWIELTRFDYLYPILGIMLFLNIALAVASWHSLPESGGGDIRSTTACSQFDDLPGVHLRLERFRHGGAMRGDGF